ncbi:sterol desaturase family protein [Atopomonas hussainii]|uniref:sterol desaturase family protein n=1 Tax=Atopomonas hussainii TaxID=1429083 RepID=UPI0009002D86|nr:sterol desaturase family protein [Atopomonas hussainii]
MLTLAQLHTALLHDIVKYLLFAGGLALLLFCLRGRLAGRRIQMRRPQWADYRREILWSLCTASLFAVSSLVGIVWLAQQGVGQLYWQLSDYSAAYALGSLLLMIVAHDAYFYWAHRALHSRWLRRLHVLHHCSRTPSPWAAYAFHPGEALTHVLFPILFAQLVPLHPFVLLLWSVHMIARNVVGHAGYELFPRVMLHSGWFNWLTTTTHHDLHHQNGRYNYGLYFTWWDRCCGTEHPQYAQRLAQALQHSANEQGERAGA